MLYVSAITDEGVHITDTNDGITEIYSVRQLPEITRRVPVLGIERGIAVRAYSLSEIYSYMETNRVRALALGKKSLVNGLDIEKGEVKGYYGKNPSVIVPDGVTKIGVSAFAGNTTIKSISLPSTLVEIAEKAFEDSKIIEIEIPESVNSIGAFAFSCAMLRKVQFKGSKISEISGFAFYCTDIGYLHLPREVGSIGGRAFACCRSLRKVIMPISVRELEAFLFNECSAIREMVIFPDVGTANIMAFMGIKSRVDVYLLPKNRFLKRNGAQRAVENAGLAYKWVNQIEYLNGNG